MSLELSDSSVEARWDYRSREVQDEGSPFTYRIAVTDAGLFTVNDSDGELLPKEPVPPFATHAEALAWCNRWEADAAKSYADSFDDE